MQCVPDSEEDNWSPPGTDERGMDNQNIDSSENLLNDAELAATRGGEILAANDPSYIPADGPQDKPRNPKQKYTAKDLGWLANWFSHIR